MRDIGERCSKLPDPRIRRAGILLKYSRFVRPRRPMLRNSAVRRRYLGLRFTALPKQRLVEA